METLELRSWQYDQGLKQEPKEVKDTTLTIIDQADQIPGLVEKLEQAREIAVDLEAHSYRSYLGFTCLMQVCGTCLHLYSATPTAAVFISINAHIKLVDHLFNLVLKMNSF